MVVVVPGGGRRLTGPWKGRIVGGGTVSQPDAAKGVACLIERRALEQQQHGEPRTPWLAFGDTVRIEFKGRDGASVFGALAQTVTGPGMTDNAAADTDTDTDNDTDNGGAPAAA